MHTESGVITNKTGLAGMLMQPNIEEKNEYALLNFKRNTETDTQEFQLVTFYKLKADGTYENGTTLEEMIRVTIERLQNLNARFSCRENSLAITKLEEALMWLNKRTQDRIERCVQGKLEK